jgi:cell wall-associated NlpC family hydrolase
MVGRLRAALPVVALLAAASPVTAQPAPLLLGPSPLADLVLNPKLAASFTAPAPVPDEVAPLILEAPALPDDVDAVDGSPAAAAPAPTGPAVLRDSGEYGIEYQLSLRDADSFLNRLTTRLKRLVEQAMTYLGTPYRLGGTSRRGLDCSGLVGAVYGEQGLGMPRTAAEQFAEGVPVAAGDLRPGDLVFFRDTYKRGISHVGIFVGEGRFIHAAGHRQGVIVSELSRPYYRLRYAGARRLPTDTGLAGIAEATAAPAADAGSLGLPATSAALSSPAARH